MMKITKEQQRALLRIVARSAQPLTYRSLRKNAQPTFGMDNAIVVPVWGMWLAIETDGYTHS